MSISSINQSNYLSVNIQYANTASVSGGAPGSGENGGGIGGVFVSSISQALSQIGVSPTGGNDSTNASGSSTSQSPEQALAAFKHDLYAALQAETQAETQADGQSADGATAATGVATGTANGAAANTAATTPTAAQTAQAVATYTQNAAPLAGQSVASAAAASSTGGASGATSGTSAAQPSGGRHHRHHGGGGGGVSRIESGLQGLLQQLSDTGSSAGAGSSSGAAASTSTSTSATTSDSTSPDSTVGALQQSFSKLLAANGQSGSSASLSGFLQALVQNVQEQAPPSTGGLLNEVG